jgi:hypothetical protein
MLDSQLHQSWVRNQHLKDLSVAIRIDIEKHHKLLIHNQSVFVMPVTYFCAGRKRAVKSSGLHSTLDLFLSCLMWRMISHPSFNMTSQGTNVTWTCFMVSPMLYNLENGGWSVGLSSLIWWWLSCVSAVRTRLSGSCFA